MTPGPFVLIGCLGGERQRQREGGREKQAGREETNGTYAQCVHPLCEGVTLI